jgi:hypothetical protein
VLFDGLGAGVFVAVASPHIMQELRDVLDLPKLRRRYGLTDDEVLGLLDDVKALSVAGRRTLPPIRPNLALQPHLARPMPCRRRELLASPPRLQASPSLAPRRHAKPSPR